MVALQRVVWSIERCFKLSWKSRRFQQDKHYGQQDQKDVRQCAPEPLKRPAGDVEDLAGVHLLGQVNNPLRLIL